LKASSAKAVTVRNRLLRKVKVVMKNHHRLADGTDLDFERVDRGKGKARHDVQLD